MYLNLIQVAESFGVSERVVEGWVQDEGMPHTPDRNRLLFDRAQVVRWAAMRGLTTRAGFLTADAPAFGTDCQIESLLRRGGIWRDVPVAQAREVIGNVLSTLPGATPAVLQLLSQRLNTPEGITWAPIGNGFALPHLRVPVALGRASGTVALLLLNEGWTKCGPTPDVAPVKRMFFFIAPSPRAHLDLLGRLAHGVRGDLGVAVIQAANDAKILAAAAAADAVMTNGNNKRKNDRSLEGNR